MNADVPSQVQAVADYLRLCIQSERRTLRSIEDELGMGAGYLGQLLRGAVDLKLKHVLGILATMGIHPVAFFGAVYEEPIRMRDPEPEPPRRQGGAYDEQLAAILLDAIRKVGAMALPEALPEAPPKPAPRLPRKRKR